MILQLTRMRDGSRKLTSVCEVVGLEGDVVTTQEIARYDQRGVDKDNKVRGSFIFTGVQPMCWASSRNTASPTTSAACRSWSASPRGKCSAFAIVLGVIGTMAFTVYAAWGRIEGYLAKFVGSFSADLERAVCARRPNGWARSSRR